MEVVERLQQTVRILSDTQTGVLVAAFVALFLVLLIQPMIFLTFKIEKSEKNSKRYTIAGCSITILVMYMLASIIFFGTSPDVINSNVLVLKVSPEISNSELLAKYEIISFNEEKDGYLFYTVRERN